MIVDFITCIFNGHLHVSASEVPVVCPAHFPFDAFIFLFSMYNSILDIKKTLVCKGSWGVISHSSPLSGHSNQRRNADTYGLGLVICNDQLLNIYSASGTGAFISTDTSLVHCCQTAAFPHLLPPLQVLPSGRWGDAVLSVSICIFLVTSAYQSWVMTSLLSESWLPGDLFFPRCPRGVFLIASRICPHRRVSHHRTQAAPFPIQPVSGMPLTVSRKDPGSRPAQAAGRMAAGGSHPPWITISTQRSPTHLISR